MEVPVRSGRESQEWSSKKIPIFDAFEVVQFLWGTAGVEVPDDQLNAYWEQAASSGVPWAQNRDSAEQLRIPLKLFGDDTRYNQQSDSVLAFIISCPLWNPQNARNGRWIIAVLEERHSLGLATWCPLLAHIVCALNKLYDEGVQVGNRNFKFEVTEISGDWKYLRQVFALRSHWNSPTDVCHHCKISRTTFPTLPEDCCADTVWPCAAI